MTRRLRSLVLEGEVDSWLMLTAAWHPSVHCWSEHYIAWPVHGYHGLPNTMVAEFQEKFPYMSQEVVLPYVTASELKL